METHRPYSGVALVLEVVHEGEGLDLAIRVVHLIVMKEHDHDTCVGLVLIGKSPDTCQLGTSDDVDHGVVESIVELHCLTSDASERGYLP